MKSASKTTFYVVRGIWYCILGSWALLTTNVALGQTVEYAEYALRRLEMLESHSEGIVLLHSRPGPADLRDSGFKQDSSFLYFTGIGNQPAAILALDGSNGESRLFVPPSASILGYRVDGATLPADSQKAQKFGLTSIEDWDSFLPYLRNRRAEGVRKLYVDEPRHPEMHSNPAGLMPITGDRTLWRLSLERALPEYEIRSAKEAIQEMRWVKSSNEIRILREVAQVSSAALMAGIRSVTPEQTQNSVAAIIVQSCFEHGAASPSFWPLVVSGNEAGAELLGVFFDYYRMNKKMSAGELARVDVGCALKYYEGDVGRTIPVSGRFANHQRETLDLLVSAYMAGLSEIHDGATFESVRSASRDEVKRLQATLQTEHARRAASLMIDTAPASVWHIHGIGIDGAETGPTVLRQGSIIAYEPQVSVGETSYYLEDMILVTEGGYEILTTGLPYVAADIEAIMDSSSSE